MKDKKGFMTDVRLREWMNQNNIDFSESEVHELMEMINASEDSRGISFEDWSRFYMQAKGSR